MNIFSYRNATVFAFIFSFFLLSCYNPSVNTKPVTRTSSFSRVIERAKKDKNYLIMHSGKDIYKVFEVELEKSKQQFTVQLNFVDSLHKVNLNTPNVLGEKHLHIYMKDSTSYTLDEPHTIPLNKVDRIELVK